MGEAIGVGSYVDGTNYQMDIKLITERVFSIAGLLARGMRSSLHSITFDKLIFVRDNYSSCKSVI